MKYGRRGYQGCITDGSESGYGPLPVFDSNKVNASKDAYQFGVPDGPVSAGVYSLIMILAYAGGSEKSNRKPVLDVLLGGAVAANLGGALYYLYDMVFKQKKVCLYCVTGASNQYRLCDNHWADHREELSDADAVAFLSCCLPAAIIIELFHFLIRRRT